MKRFITVLFITAHFFAGSYERAVGQVTGTVNVPGTYPTLAAAVTDLNVQGVGVGGATINLMQSEDAPVGGYALGSTLLNASLSASNPLVINGNGNTLTAYTGTGSTDVLFRIRGVDYLTIDGLNLTEKPTNSNSTTRMEWGYALLKLNGTLPYDGCQHVTIRNCTISLNFVDVETIGIRSASHHEGVTTALSPTGATATDANSYNRFYGNTITGVQWGIQILGLNNVSVYDTDNIIGVPTGNQITTGILSGTQSRGVYGIYYSNNNSAVVHNNTLRTTAFQRGEVNGVFLEKGNGAVSVKSNNMRFVVQATANSSIYGIRNAFTDPLNNMVISDNEFVGWNNSRALVTSPIFSDGPSFDSIIVNNNSFDTIIHRDNNLRVIFINAGGTSKYVAVLNNQISNVSSVVGSTFSTIKGIELRNTNAQARIVVRDNEVRNIINNTTNTGFNYHSYGIEVAAGDAPMFVQSNRVENFTNFRNNLTTAISATTGHSSLGDISNNVVQHMRTEQGGATGISGRVANVFNNEVRDLVTADGMLKGYVHNAGGAVNLYNNIFTGLRNTGITGAIQIVDLNWARNGANLYNNLFTDISWGSGFAITYTNQVCVINIPSSALYRIFHNTIKVTGGANPGARFGASAVMAGSTARIDLRNNIIHIDALPGTVGCIAAVSRSAGTAGTAPTANNFTADGNVYHLPAADSCFVYMDGNAVSGFIGVANAFGPLNDPAFNKSCGLYKTFMGNAREQHSYTENNLIAGAVPGTFVPSGASYAKGVGVITASPAVATDYAGASRPNPGSDAGALQFTGAPADTDPPVITYDLLPALSCDTLPPVLSATITDNIAVSVASGTAPRLYFRKQSESNAFGSYPADNVPGFNGWKYVEGKPAGSNVFHFEFDYDLLTGPVAAGDVISYFVIAQDGAGNGVTSTAAFPATFCMGGVNLPAAAGPVEATPVVNSFTVQDQPLRLLTPSGQVSLCGGNAVDLEVPAPGATYVWYRNDTLIPGAASDVYQVDSAGAYHAFVVTTGCFYTTDATELSEDAKPVVVNIGTLSFCVGDTTLLYTDSSVSGRSYGWLLDGASIQGASYASLPVLTSGNYQVVVTGGGCVDTSLATTILVLPTPSVQVTTSTGDTFFCAGSSLDLEAATGYAAYRWQKDGVDIASGGSGDTYSAAEPGVYRVVITGSNGCSDSSDLLTIISDTAHATLTLSGGNTVCSDDSLVLRAPQVAGYTYIWKKGNDTLTATGSSYTARESGAYKVIVTTIYDCVDSSAATSLLVDTAGAALTASGTLTFCKGDSVVLSAPAATGYTYVWKKDDVVFPFTDSAYAARQTGGYKVIVTTPNNCVDSSSVVHVVSDTAQAVMTYATALTFCKGDSVVFTAQQRAGYTYAWLKDGAAQSPVTPAYGAKQSGAYRMVVSSANNCRDTSAALNVVSDTVRTAVTHATPLTFCKGDSVVLQAPVVTGYSYVWRKDGVTLSPVSNAYAAKQSGGYRAVITSVNACVDSSSVFSVVSDTAAVSVTADGPLTFCKSDSVRLSAVVGYGYSHAWRKDGAPLSASGSVYTAKESGAHRVVVTTGNNCVDSSVLFHVISDTAVAVAAAMGPVVFCDGDSVILEASVFTGYSYEWHNAAGAVPGALDERYTALSAGDYYLVVTTANGCLDTSDVIDVIVNTMPRAVLTIEGDTVFCSGNSVLLSTTSGPGYTWQWRRNGQDITSGVDSFFEVRFSGAYDVIVSAGNSCVDTSVIREIVVIPSPVPGIIARDPNMKTGSQYVSYQWYLNGYAIEDATDSFFRAQEIGAYTVEVTDSAGCAGMSLVYNLHTMDIMDVTDVQWFAELVRVYPNPATQFIRVDAPSPVHSALYSMDGKLLMRPQQEPVISIGALPDGVYMLRITNDEGAYIKTERVVKSSH